MASKKNEGLTIFILDDEKDIAHFVQGFFLKRGFEVHTALNAKVATTLLNKIHPHIALLDVRLSEKDSNGLEVLKLIKEKFPSCQCLIVSYVDDQRIIAQAKALGAKGYLKKPLTIPEIEKAVLQLVGSVKEKSSHG